MTGRSSNPIGFAYWFKDICDPGYSHIDYLSQKQLLFETYGQRPTSLQPGCRISPTRLSVPPLQQGHIQIMKPPSRYASSGIVMRVTAHLDDHHYAGARLYEGRASQYQTTRSVLRFIIDTLAQHAALVENRVARRHQPDAIDPPRR
ncbi:MAG: hypothetical protein R3C45_18410 [Phycisphaerales bacterium]